MKKRIFLTIVTIFTIFVLAWNADALLTLNKANLYTVKGNSMLPILNEGDIVRIESINYETGDLVVARNMEGKLIIKRLVGQRLLSEGLGTDYLLNEVRVLGKAKIVDKIGYLRVALSEKIEFVYAEEPTKDMLSWDIFSFNILPSMRGIASTVYQDKIYIGGRYDSSEETYIFDGFQWVRGADLPDARRNASFAEYNGELYCVGGSRAGLDYADTVWKLNNISGQWEDIGKPLPMGLINTGLISFNDSGTEYLYAIGGISSTGRTNKVFRFNGSDWTDISELAVGGNKHKLPEVNSVGSAITVLGGKIYATGFPEGKMYSYDGVTAGSSGTLWKAETSLPIHLGDGAHHALLAFNEKIYAIGGDTGSGTGRLLSWSPGSGSWTIEPFLPRPSFRHGRAVLGEHIYIIGGAESTGGANVTNQVNRYPGSVLSTNQASWQGGEQVNLRGIDLTNGEEGDVISVSIGGIAATDIGPVCDESVNLLGKGSISTISFKTGNASTGIAGKNDLVVTTARGTLTKKEALTIKGELIWSGEVFVEKADNDGSIANEITLEAKAASFAITAGNMAQGTHYTVAGVPAGLSVQITGTGERTAKISLTGNALCHLNVDSINNLRISFTAAAFATGSYTDLVNTSKNNLQIRFFDTSPSNNAELSSLVVNAGVFEPAFNSAITGYSLNVANTIDKIRVTPTSTDANAQSIKINESIVLSGQPSEELSLNIGDNTIVLIVTAEDIITTKTYTLIVNRATPPPTPTGDSESYDYASSPPTNNNTDFNISFAGKDEKVGIINKKKENGKSILEVVLDTQRIKEVIKEIISQASAARVLTIQINDNQSQTGRLILSGEVIQILAKEGFQISFSFNGHIYNLPAEEFKVIENEQNFKTAELKIQISREEEMELQFAESLSEQGCKLLASPLSYEIVYNLLLESGDNKTFFLTSFNNFLERIIEIPSGSHLEGLITGVILEGGGSYHHVPTEIFRRDGKLYARIRSLTNSTYSVIQSPIKSVKMNNHWAEETVQEMVARRIILNENSFCPRDCVTRAEFASYLTRALGLHRNSINNPNNPFKDIEKNNINYSGILIAVQRGIIKGYPDGTFRPNDLITREEAMAMYARSMDIAHLTADDPDRITNYRDKGQVSLWAQESVAKTLGAGVFNGRSTDKIEPKAYFTHAEAVTAIKNLLTKAGLIN